MPAFLKIGFLGALVFLLACGGSSVDGVTETCGPGEVSVGTGCEPEPKPDHKCATAKDCDDGSKCTANDRCVNERCFYDDACDDGDSGTEDACTSAVTGTCSHTEVGGASSSTSSGGGSCVPEKNEDGSTEVVFSVELSTGQAVSAQFTNDWNGGWPNAVTYTNQANVTIQGMMLSGVHVLNAAFNDGTYLVEGKPSVHLASAESTTTASFGGCPAVTAEQLSSGEVFPAHSLRYAWRVGEQGPNLLFCNSQSKCVVSVY
jgi:hypothetical protein